MDAAIPTAGRSPPGEPYRERAGAKTIAVVDGCQLRVGTPRWRSTCMAAVVPLSGAVNVVDGEGIPWRRVCFGRILFGALEGFCLRAGDHTDARCLVVRLSDALCHRGVFFGSLGVTTYRLVLRSTGDGSPLHESLGTQFAGLLGARARSCRRLPGAGGNSRALYDRLLEAKDHAESTAACRVHDMARLSSSSISHFPRLFRAAFGCAPKQHIDSCRVRLAKSLLVWSDANLTEIGMTCGFLDRTAFARAFGRLAGMPPSAFRKRFADSRVPASDLGHFQ